MKNVNINEKGRSMVEMLGVLAIIGVLSAGGLAGYSKAMFKHKLNTTIDQITMVVTNIRTLYGTQGNYTGLGNKVAVEAGIVPSSMGTSETLYNPFKGEVHIATAEAKSGLTDTAFVIQYTNLPSEACVQISTSDFGSGSGSGFIGVQASNGKTTKTNAKTAYNWIAPNGGMILDLLFPTASAAGEGGADDGDDDAGAGAADAGAADSDSLDFAVYVGDENEGKPLQLSDAIAACSGAGTTNSVTLKFY